VFTGIVEEVGRVRTAQPGTLVIAAGVVLRDIGMGASINVNGVCLTVTRFGSGSFSVDIMPETAQRSTLGRLRAGDGVNLERAVPLGGRLGGHLVQGHVDAMGRVSGATQDGTALLVEFDAPTEVMRYVVEKGFVAVDGISLTVVSRSAASFRVSVVGYTRQHTTLGEIRVGDQVNLEADIIAKYVEVLSRPQEAGITADFLRQHGFLVG